MKQITRFIIIVALLATINASAEEAKQPDVASVSLADVTVTAQPTGKRHQSYVFTLTSKKTDASWAFELYEDFGGALLLHVAGNQTKLNEKKDLQSWHHKATVLRLQKIEPKNTRTGETITDKLLSFTWGQQEPNTAIDSDKK